MNILELTLRRLTINLSLLFCYIMKLGNTISNSFPNSTSSTTPYSYNRSKMLSAAFLSLVDK